MVYDEPSPISPKHNTVLSLFVSIWRRRLVVTTEMFVDVGQRTSISDGSSLCYVYTDDTATSGDDQPTVSFKSVFRFVSLYSLFQKKIVKYSVG